MATAALSENNAKLSSNVLRCGNDVDNVKRTELCFWISGVTCEKMFYSYSMVQPVNFVL